MHPFTCFFICLFFLFNSLITISSASFIRVFVHWRLSVFFLIYLFVRSLIWFTCLSTPLLIHSSLFALFIHLLTHSCTSLLSHPQNDTVTHSSRKHKQVVPLSWLPPDDYNGTVVFKWVFFSILFHSRVELLPACVCTGGWLLSSLFFLSNSNV